MGASPTIRDVADLARVSTGTVSNFLNQTKPIAPATANRIQDAIDQLNFIPNVAVRLIHGHRSPTVGLIVPEVSNPFFTDVARGVEDVTYEAGLVVVVCNTQGDVNRERQYLRVLSEMRVSGILITPMNVSDRVLQRFSDGGGRVVLLDEPPREADFASVAVNDVEGGRLAAAHLLELGHRRLVFVGGPAGHRQVSDRYAGARLAVDSVKGAVMRRVDARGTTTSSRRAAANEILHMDPRPTAVFCANDLIALSVANELMSAGLRVPSDMAVIGYDDIDLAGAAPVPLSTVRQPQYELGAAAARLLLNEEVMPPEHVTFTPELVARESTLGRGPSD